MQAAAVAGTTGEWNGASAVPRGENHSFPRHSRSPKVVGPSSQKYRFYAVAVGHEPGIYCIWDYAKKQVHGYVNAKYGIQFVGQG